MSLLPAALRDRAIRRHCLTSPIDGMYDRPYQPGKPGGSLSDQILNRAFGARRKDLPVEGSGVIVRLLEDDLDGARHQRFILRLTSGQTLLVAHNIDKAARLAPLGVGDTVSFKGEYRWNDLGGVIHWTHTDPDDLHASGWLRLDQRASEDQ